MMRHRSCHGEKGNKKRIAIIGAGPAGLSAAYFLKEQGYQDVLVLEKLGRVGGMCRTITEDYKSFDLGANYLTPAYLETLRLARKYKMKRISERSPTAIKFAKGKGKKPFTIRSIWKAATETHTCWELFKSALKYSWLRYKLWKVINPPGFRNISKRKDLCVDFESWLKENDLLALKHLFEIPITIMGYGYLNQIAAPYALKYMSLMTFIPMMFKVFPLTSWLPWPKRFKYGYQRLWEAVARDLNVRLNIDITQVERKEDKIEITFTHKYQMLHEQKTTEQDTFRFDYLIVACPLERELLGELLDQDQKEKDAFQQTQAYSYCLTSFNVEFPDIPWEDQLFATVPLTKIEHPWAITRQFEDSTLMQFYTRVPPMKKNDSEEKLKKVEKEVVKNVEKFVEILGGQIDKKDEWHTYDRWPYFQHVTPKDMEDGFYDRLEALQGHRRTFYTGGLMNFELVEQIIAYNRDLIQKNFPKVKIL